MPVEVAELVVDNLGRIARFTGRPTGEKRVISVRTREPRRDFTVVVDPEKVELEVGDGGRQPDIELAAEAFVRLVYGRLDPEHASGVNDRSNILGELRQVFPGM